MSEQPRQTETTSVMEGPIQVLRVIVSSGRLSLLVRIDQDQPRYMYPNLVYQVLAEFPEIVAHACINDVGSHFGDVIDQTSIPHLLEHLIISEQVRDPHTVTDMEFVGVTHWIDEVEGTARVEVNFADDLIALRAFNKALQFINERMVF